MVFLVRLLACLSPKLVLLRRGERHHPLVKKSWTLFDDVSNPTKCCFVSTHYTKTHRF